MSRNYNLDARGILLLWTCFLGMIWKRRYVIHCLTKHTINSDVFTFKLNFKEVNIKSLQFFLADNNHISLYSSYSFRIIPIIPLTIVITLKQFSFTILFVLHLYSTRNSYHCVLMSQINYSPMAIPAAQYMVRFIHFILLVIFRDSILLIYDYIKHLHNSKVYSTKAYIFQGSLVFIPAPSNLFFLSPTTGNF